MKKPELQSSEETRIEDRILGYKTSRVLSKEELEQVSGGNHGGGTAEREDESHQ